MTQGQQIFIVDDHHIFRLGLRAMLEQYGYEVEEASNGSAAIDRLSEREFDLVLIDYMMPEMNGLDVYNYTRNIGMKTPFMFLTALNDSDKLESLLHVDILGMISKNMAVDEVANAVKRSMDGQPYYDSNLIATISKKRTESRALSNGNTVTDFSVLTKRELTILDLVAKGLSNVQIAEELFISKRTVEKHRYNILSKTLHKNFYSLIMEAHAANVVPLEEPEE